ncbi:ATP diphosphatase [Bartonella sp. AR 15-3]|uniref:hypothetical protein n=1 Tax=Bartonella sp. AR 15-3 TaxID=545617 RepID=UPI0009C8BBA4|nr:ATP diphosphatase [Bartonella sp. AR 15-3]
MEKAKQTKQYEEISVADNRTNKLFYPRKSARPADQEALALQSIAAKVGFEWYENDQIFAKIKEEINKLKKAIKIKKSDIEIEFGNLYYTLLYLARHLNIDPKKYFKKLI